MSESAGPAGQEPFVATTRQALEHVADPAWLAANSPLATPYFLGARSHNLSHPDSTALGRALVDLLHETADSLWEGGPPPTRTALIDAVEEARRTQGNSGDEYNALLLELRYLRRYFLPDEYPVESADIAVYLTVSQTRFFVHLKEAIERLAGLLLRRVQPALRLEQPQMPGTFVGRARERRELAAALAAGTSVSLTGPPGAGKTTLGIALSQDRTAAPVFWHTFLPGLNDTLDALLFSLAHFAHTYGRSALWTYLLATSGTAIEPAQATGLLRADLVDWSGPAPLLIMDEVDLLRTADGEPRSATHSLLFTFLESLVEMTPVLLIGQRGYVDTPVHLSLSSLDRDAVAALLDTAGTHLPRVQVQRVREVTGGLPRLIWLVIALLRSGEDVEEITRLHLRGDATPLFHRLWRRLDQSEKEMLVALSVYRRSAPADIWASHAAARESLHERRLLDEMSEAGEIALRPFFQRLIYQELQPAQREQFHLHAARVRAERGEFTAAAYHFVQANEPESAIGVWFSQRELEIGRGQAGMAREIFAGISGKGLPVSVIRRLKVIQNQLYLLTGESERAIENFSGITWDIDDSLTAEAYAQAARAAYATGNVDGALTHYGESAQVLGRIVGDMIDRHTRRGAIYLDEGDLKAAQAEALFAEQRLVVLQGQIAYVRNDYEAALAAHQRALQMAETLQRPDLVAESKRRMAEVFSMQGEIGNAESLLADAAHYYEEIGDRLRSEELRVVLGTAYVNARLYDRAILPTEQALAFLQKTGQTQFMAQPLAQLAEAYMETGQTEKAIDYAYQVLNLEVPLYRPYAYYSLGLAQQRQGREDIAAAAFAEGLAAASQTGDRFIEAYLHRNVGRLLAAQGDKTAAREPLTAALELFRRMKIAQEIPDTEKDLAGLD